MRFALWHPLDRHALLSLIHVLYFLVRTSRFFHHVFRGNDVLALSRIWFAVLPKRLRSKFCYFTLLDVNSASLELPRILKLLPLSTHHFFKNCECCLILGCCPLSIETNKKASSLFLEQVKKRDYGNEGLFCSENVVLVCSVVFWVAQFHFHLNGHEGNLVSLVLEGVESKSEPVLADIPRDAEVCA